MQPVPRDVRIHFICTGNLYRSRLAEAYCASRRIPGLHVSSSGIAAGATGDAAISPHAADILAHHDLGPYAAERWQRTTQALVQASDIIVFMESGHRHFCADWIDPARQRIEVWEIEDIGPADLARISEKVKLTFERIRHHTDTLLASLGLGNVASS